MRISAVLTLALLPLLAGCSDSDWNNLLGFGSSDKAAGRPVAVAAPRPIAAPTPAAPIVQAPVTQAQAAPTLNPLCLGSARQDAMTNDFDAATQQKVAARSYQQCQQVFGDSGN